MNNINIEKVKELCTMEKVTLTITLPIMVTYSVLYPLKLGVRGDHR